MTNAPSTHPRPVWDIFCQVIDNFGDLGVCWRLAAELGQSGCAVRLWTDDASALAWMAPHGAPHVQVLDWSAPIPATGVGDVVVEAFGCEIPQPFQHAMAARAQQGPRPPVWINLEYLSAESYVERCHRLPSRIMSGPATGMTRWFFYPGFTERTGGLLREADLPARQAAFDRSAWRARQGLADSDRVISLFSYEASAFAQVFADTQIHGERTGPGDTPLRAQWLVTPGRSAALARRALPADQQGTLHFVPPCSQPQFDEMLWACDLNFVRGEDSLVRALWAGQPFIWHIYPQDDLAHHAKLQAFLDWLDAPTSLRQAHATWNDVPTPGAQWPHITSTLLATWAQCVQTARNRLWAQAGLTEQLMTFAAEKG